MNIALYSKGIEMVKQWFRSFRQMNRNRREQAKNDELRFQLKTAAFEMKRSILECDGKIPVLIVCYNNGVYVTNMVSNLQKYDIKPIVLNNYSTDRESIKILNNLEKNGEAYIVNFQKNYGHMVAFLAPIYELLPEVFACTDPDIQFSSTMPASFLDDLALMTTRYLVFKAGLAMSLTADEEISKATVKLSATEPIYVNTSFSIHEGEAPFWRRKLEHESLDVYTAKIDTIFAVYRKQNYRGDFFDAVRVAGDYSAIHLPWFPRLDPMSDDQKKQYLTGNISTTWLK